LISDSLVIGPETAVDISANVMQWRQTEKLVESLQQAEIA